MNALMEPEVARAMPEVNDVVEGIDGLRGIVRAVHPSGHVRVASHGDHDEGVWVKTDHVTVVYREGATPERRTRTRPNFPRVRDTRSRQGHPIQTIRADAEVMAEALKLAGGDARRLQVNRDGSVYVR